MSTTAAQVSGAAYFVFDYPPAPETFVFMLTDPQKIQHARNIASGEETDRVHVMGRIRKVPVPYNVPWQFHLDPDTIDFFNMAIEVCDAHPRYVEDHVDEACGAFLPGCIWCPWGSRILKEISWP